MVPMPLRPSRIPALVESASSPRFVTAPRPVTTMRGVPGDILCMTKLTQGQRAGVRNGCCNGPRPRMPGEWWAWDAGPVRRPRPAGQVSLYAVGLLDEVDGLADSLDLLGLLVGDRRFE